MAAALASQWGVSRFGCCSSGKQRGRGHTPSLQSNSRRENAGRKLSLGLLNLTRHHNAVFGAPSDSSPPSWIGARPHPSSSPAAMASVYTSAPVADRLTKEVCRNRKAKYNYELLDKFQCGIELQGTEVKSVRAGKVSLQEAFCRVIGLEVMLLNANISQHSRANSYDNHDPLRKRRLLLNRREILKLRQKQEEKGLTIVPLRMYFSGSWLKVEIALARGKKIYDKREDIKNREAKRDMGRISKLQL